MSNSWDEAGELMKQLTYFHEVTRLRSEVTVRDMRIAELEAKVKDLETRANAIQLRHLDCPNCEAALAPADRFENGEWLWENGKGYECENCGASSTVRADEEIAASLELWNPMEDEDFDDTGEDGEPDNENDIGGF